MSTEIPSVASAKKVEEWLLDNFEQGSECKDISDVSERLKLEVK